MKKNNEKNYMLFIYGNFKGGDKLVSEIMSSLEPVLSSDCLKFTYGDFGIVAHFRTTYSFNELSEYCKYVLNVWVSQYFLIENNGNAFGHAEDDIVEHIFNLDVNVEDFHSKLDEDSEVSEYGDVKNFSDLYLEFMNKLNTKKDDVDFEFEDDYDEEEDDEDNLITKRWRREKSFISLNDILDKITEKGMNSLTEFEKQQLNKYANG